MSYQTHPLRSVIMCIATGCALTGCTNIPELDATVPPSLQQADYPALVPIETLLTPLPPVKDNAEDVQSDLENRRDALQDRARRLNAQIVDDESRARMQAGVPQ